MSPRSDASRPCELFIPWVLVEVEMRAAEAPLEADLDVKGLRAQVLERIAVLEDREREKEDLLAEVAVLAKGHGLDAWALKTIPVR